MPNKEKLESSPVKLRAYFFVLAKWVGSSMFIGFFLASMVGGHPEGGMFVFTIIWIIGTFVGVIRSLILVSRSQNIAHQVIITLVSGALISWVYASIYFDSQCGYTEKQATQTVQNHLKNHKKNLQYLSKPTTSGCDYYFHYEGERLKRDYLFSRGRLQWMDE